MKKELIRWCHANPFLAFSLILFAIGAAADCCLHFTGNHR